MQRGPLEKSGGFLLLREYRAVQGQLTFVSQMNANRAPWLAEIEIALECEGRLLKAVPHQGGKADGGGETDGDDG